MDNFKDILEAVCLKKFFEIDQENVLQFSKMISFLGKKKSTKY